MRQLFILSVVCLSCISSWAQGGKLEGIVKDSLSGVPLDAATIVVQLEDSSILTYQLTDRNGRFSIDDLPAQSVLYVSASFIGYREIVSKVTVGGISDTLNFLMVTEGTQLLNEVVVLSVKPIRMNGDTLEINPAAFKMREDAVVEELLNQVKGIVIWSDGSVTVNGRPVQNVFVDGKPFLGSSDPRIATQNLPKAAVDKIQFYEEYDRSRIGNEPSILDSVLTMNIQLNENSKRGYFGKAGGGYGSDDRFEADLAVQMYNPKNSFGIAGGYNNINKQIEDIQNIFLDNTYQNFNPDLFRVGHFGAPGLNKKYSIGGIFSHNFTNSPTSIRQHRATVNYNHTGIRSSVNTNRLLQQASATNQMFRESDENQYSHEDGHKISFEFIKASGFSDNFTMGGVVQTSRSGRVSGLNEQVLDKDKNLMSRNTGITESSGTSGSQSISARIAKSSSEEPLKNYSLNLSLYNSTNEERRLTKSLFESFSGNMQLDSFNRNYSINGSKTEITGSLDYQGFKRLILGRYNLFGINLSLNQYFRFEKDHNAQTATDFDSSSKTYITNGGLTYRHSSSTFSYSPIVVLSKSFMKSNNKATRFINLDLRLKNDLFKEDNVSSTPERNVSRTLNYFGYSAAANWGRNIRQKNRIFVALHLMNTAVLPPIDKLYPVTDNINVYEIVSGNPFLRKRVMKSSQLNFNYSTENPRSVYSFSAQIRTNYQWLRNGVADSVVHDISGKRTLYPVNVNSDNFSVTPVFNISRKIKSSQITFRSNGYVSYQRMPNFVDGISNKTEVRSFYNQAALQVQISKKVVLDVKYYLQHYKATQQAEMLPSYSVTETGLSLGSVFNINPKLTLSSTLQHTNNSSLEKDVVLINSFVTWRFMKRQAELKFTAMDILKQYKNIHNSATAFGTRTTITNGLQQYALLTFSYYPRRFGKVPIRKQSEVQETFQHVVEN